MPWKVGFPNDAWSYKRCDRYKRNLEDAIEEKMNSMFETKFRSYMQSLTAFACTANYSESITVASPKLHWLHNSVPTWYPIDDITGETLCRLHIPIGRVGNKTKEVVIGVAMSVLLFHNNPILAEYAKVLIHEITDMACIDYPQYHATPEGIKELGEGVNQFILGHR
jgi:hypothetical protein